MSEFDSFALANIGEKDELIDPISFREPGQCPVCGSSLIVADMEINLFSIAPNGKHVNEIETYVDCKAVCSNCGKQVDMMRLNGLYRPKSDIAFAIEEQRLREIIEQREKQDNLTHRPANPFAY